VNEEKGRSRDPKQQEKKPKRAGSENLSRACRGTKKGGVKVTLAREESITAIEKQEQEKAKSGKEGRRTRPRRKRRREDDDRERRGRPA